MQGHVIFFLLLLFQIVLPPDSFVKWRTIKGIVAVGRTPINGATVTLLGWGRPGVLTDSTGFFMFDSVLHGNPYTLRVVAEGFNSMETRVKASNADPIELKLNLARDIIDSATARLDIESGTPRLLIIGGFAGSPPNTSDDDDFEDDYGIEYYSFGCTMPAFDIGSYNRVVFRYLDEKFGGGWRGDVRRDVIGLMTEGR